MTRFHTDEFVDFLHRVTPETVLDMTGGGMRCELLCPDVRDHAYTPATMLVLTGEDNPAFDGLFEFCSISAGGSLGEESHIFVYPTLIINSQCTAAADRINTGMADIAINWAGGLHHAKRGEASGFCYINDIGRVLDCTFV